MKNTGVSVKRFLVVEEEPGICEVCLRAFTGARFEVDIAVSGDVAQYMLGKKDYDLCLIDIGTPIMNGKQLYQAIVEKHPKLAKGVIFTTEAVISGDTQSFLKLTGREFLPKPFTPDEIKTTVRKTLRQIEK